MAQTTSEGSSRIYNLVTVIFVVLTALTLCAVVVLAVTNPNKGAGLVGGEPTVMGFGTNTPTLLGPTPNATWTASPSPTITVTFTPSKTPIPSATSTPTNTPTATNTLTPTNTPKPTATNTATNTPTKSPFDYLIYNGQAVYMKNSKFSGCDAVLAGIVKDLNGNQASQIGMKIFVTGNEADNVVNAGDHPEYGVSGWEYYFNNVAVARTYFVQLQYPDGTPASATWSITTSSSCNENLAFITWVQVQPRSS